MLPQIQSGTVHALAVMGAKRSVALKDVPTIAQSGLVGFNVASWNALAAPSKTPTDIVARLNKEVLAALNSPDVKKSLLDLKDRKSTRLNSSHGKLSRMPSSA